MLIFRASGGTAKHSPDNIKILHCIAPQGRKFWGLGGFTMFLFIFAISHAYFLMFSYIILIYLCKLPYFTYHLGRGGPPPSQSSNLRFVQNKIFLNYFLSVWPMWFDILHTDSETNDGCHEEDLLAANGFTRQEDFFINNTNIVSWRSQVSQKLWIPWLESGRKSS